MTDVVAQQAPDSSGEGAGTGARMSRPALLVAGLAVVLIIVVLLALLDLIDIGSWFSTVGGWWVSEGWPWTARWMLSPGFGGAAAVVAASLAFVGSRHQVRLNAWWQRVEWALNLYVKPDATDSEVRAGIAALEALEKSSLAKTDEKTFIREVVTAVSLDDDGDGDAADDHRSDNTRSGGKRGTQTAQWRTILVKLSELRDTHKTETRTGGPG